MTLDGAIFEELDGITIACGDLGMEIPMEMGRGRGKPSKTKVKVPGLTAWVPGVGEREIFDLCANHLEPSKGGRLQPMSRGTSGYLL